MPFIAVPGSNLGYYLINFDPKGQECLEEDGKFLSQLLCDIVQTEPISDVFLFSHGWMTDIPAACDQYGKWIQAMITNTVDIEEMKKIRPDFMPLLVGLHWPSAPWDEKEYLEAATPEMAVEAMVSCYASRIADTDSARAALQTIITEGLNDLEPGSLSSTLIKAYTILNKELDLDYEGVAGAPGYDRETFDPEVIYEESELEIELLEESESYGSFDVNPIHSPVFAPLRYLSYWKMKSRAREIGENAGFKLLSELQHNSSNNTRFHLIGHSFGCIFASATLAGPKNRGVLPHPVNSLTLIQGAMSLWSYCSDIPKARGKTGYFYPIVLSEKVNGPIVTTSSDSDNAVNWMYGLASGIVLSSVDFAPGDFPKYGAIGAHGIQGNGILTHDWEMGPIGYSYQFETGKIYNLDASKYIIPPKHVGLEGSHNAIDKPEVAHAVWSAAMAS
jgi:hypothetical protein